MLTLGASVGTLVTNGWPGEIWALIVGAGLATLTFWWMAGGRASATTWLRGAEGERLTARELATLDGEEWIVVHDVPRASGGNWDHLVFGPPGVVLLDTKNWGGQPHVVGDDLVAGRVRHKGAASRAAAAALGATLAPLVGRRPWVEPAVVVWGGLDRPQSTGGVTYVPGCNLCDWLTSLPRGSWVEGSSAAKELTKLG